MPKLEYDVCARCGSLFDEQGENGWWTREGLWGNEGATRRPARMVARKLELKRPATAAKTTPNPRRARICARRRFASRIRYFSGPRSTPARVASRSPRREPRPDDRVAVTSPKSSRIEPIHFITPPDVDSNEHL